MVPLVMDVGVRVPQLLVVLEQGAPPPTIEREGVRTSPAESLETEMLNVVWVVVPATTVGGGGEAIVTTAAGFTVIVALPEGIPDWFELTVIVKSVEAVTNAAAGGVYTTV